MLEESKEKGGREKEKGEEMYHGSAEGYYVSKRNIWPLAGGALGALAAIAPGKAAKKARPAIVGALKEGYAFKKELLMKMAEKIMEDAENILAEAKHACHKDLDASSEAVKREKKVLQEIEEELGKRKKRMTSMSRRNKYKTDKENTKIC